MANKIVRIKRNPQDSEALGENIKFGIYNKGGIPAPTRKTVNVRSGEIKRNSEPKVMESKQRIMKALRNSGPTSVKEKKQNRVR